MIPDLGQLALYLALLTALVSAIAPRWYKKLSPLPLLSALAITGFLLITLAFAALVYSYAVSDFSVLNVVLNSHSQKEYLYKLTGSWGNHEGSMLLWAWILSGYGFLIALLRAEDRQLKTDTLRVLGWVGVGFLTFLIFTSNPFIRVFPVPLEGEDLNPLLQDIGLALHPPTLYIGYVGFGVVFAYAVAGMLRGKIDSAWARQVQPWILLPWSFLTLGIGAGSWWAYRELGWGGWWFWDPVENVALLPWLAGTALIHATMVLEKRGALARWVALLAVLTFSLSLIGTFIVRSGLITSVHAFATDPERGLFILAYIAAVTGTALFIYARSSLSASPRIALQSRTGLIVIGNILLLAATGTVLLAILFPIMVELLGGTPISVGAPYFNRTFLPLTAPLIVLAAIAPLLAWDKAGSLKKHLLSLSPALLVALATALAIAWPPQLLKIAGLALGFWLVLGVIQYVRKLRRTQLRFFSPVGLRSLASAVAHLGAAVFVLGITATSLFKQVHEAPLDPKKPLVLGEYTLTLTGAEKQTFGNYESRIARFDITKDGKVITTLAPELRYYPARQMQTTEAALYSTPMRDLYLVIGEATYGKSTIGVRFYVTPGQQWIWWGFVLAGIGGLIGLAGAVWRWRAR